MAIPDMSAIKNNPVPEEPWYAPIWDHLTGNYGPGASNGAMASNMTSGNTDIYDDDAPSSLVEDSEKGTIEKWAQSQGYTLNKDTLDYLYNQYFTEKNNETAWQRTLEADKTKYQRAVEDMRAAGLNPFLAINNSFSSPSATAGSVGSGSIAASQNSRRQSGSDVSKQLLASLGLMFGALIYALL